MAIEHSEVTANISWSETPRHILRRWSREWLALARWAKPKLLLEPKLTRVVFGDRQILIRKGRLSEEIAIYAGDDAEPGGPVAALKLHASGRAGIEIEFLEGDVLRPTVRMPKSKRNVLGKALYFELARICPVAISEVYFDYELEPARADGLEVLARLRVIRRTSVDQATALSHAAGLQIARIRLGGDLKLADWRVFPVDRWAMFVFHWERIKLVALAATAVLLAFLVIAAVYSRGNAGLSDVSRRIAAAQVEAAETTRLRAEWDKLVLSQSFLDAQRHKPGLAQTLARLARGLPQDTWATGLQLTGRRIRLQGYSRSASHLISNIGDMGFSNPQFEAPVTRDALSKAERFDVSFEVKQ